MDSVADRRSSCALGLLLATCLLCGAAVSVRAVQMHLESLARESLIAEMESTIFQRPGSAARAETNSNESEPDADLSEEIMGHPDVYAI